MSSQFGELIPSSSTTYLPKSANDIVSFSFNNNTWVYKDKSGTVYTYGSQAATRQDDPSDAAHVYRWMLESVKDANGNIINYSYFKDAGQIYPLAINYGGGAYTVNFSRIQRTDFHSGYQTAFLVTTSYLISNIQVSVQNSVFKTYLLAYSNNAITQRSELTSVTLRDSAVSYPPTTFDYQVESQKGFSSSNISTALPIPVSKGTVAADVNGDGYPDILNGYELNQNLVYSVEKRTAIYHPQSNNWQINPTWQMPDGIMIYTQANTPRYEGTSVIDVNGDLKPDLIGYGGSLSGYPPDQELNNGNGWTNTPNWQSAVSNQGVRLEGDLNGDGLPDFFGTYTPNGAQAGVNTISLNTGSDFNNYSNNSTNCPPATNTTIPFCALPSSLGYYIPVDINNDGLTDLIKSDDYQTCGGGFCHDTWDKKIYLNTGTSWVLDSNWTFPDISYFYNSYFNGPSFNNIIFTDINNDGYIDFFVPGSCGFACNGNPPGAVAYINNGHGWTLDPNWYSPAYIYGDVIPGAINALMADFNADGSPDFLGNSGTLFTNNNHNQVDLLSKITMPAGAVTSISYQSSAQYKDTGGNLLNPNLPLIIQTAASITTTEPVSGLNSTYSYSYSGGSYFYNGPLDRKFAGFEKVMETRPDGSVVTNYYHQGDTSNAANYEYNDNEGKIGYVYRTDITDGGGALQSRSTTKYETTNPASGAYFVFPSQTVNETFGPTPIATASTYAYDTATGNLTGKTDWGSVTATTPLLFTDIGNDQVVTTYIYATDGQGVYKLSDEASADQNGNKVRQSRYYYDALPLGALSLGNNTKTEQWQTGANYVNTQKTFNSFGLPISATDERGKVTSFVYDSFNLYPSAVTNPLNQTSSYVYDYGVGKPTQITDPNNLTHKLVYDGTGRVKEQDEPDINAPANLVVKTSYLYTDTPNQVSVQKTDYLDADNSLISYQYFDGLGRLLQERQQSENLNTFNASDLAYNAMGQMQKQSLPYSSSASARTVPAADISLYTSYNYDALGRVLNISNAVGTTGYLYNGLKTTVTDPDGKLKNYYRDAYDNLVGVDEINGTATYTTSYAWNLNKNLINITDALGNVRNFTYDGLGRRLSAEDLHAPGDATFGVWAYGYDNAGNIIQTLNPNGQAVNYAYDDINRQLTEDFTGTAGTDVAYSYDFGTNGIGHLTGIVSPALMQTNAYNALGIVQNETKTINGSGYSTNYNYDRQKNLLTVSNPDNSQVMYSYNSAGLVEAISEKDTATGTPTAIINNIDYSPGRQPTILAYANGATTANTYDASHLYRLSSKITATASSTVQSLSYTYDAVGNITQLVDASQTDTAKTANYSYDDLYRLTQTAVTNVPAGQTGYTENYTYNAIGNLTSKTGQGNYVYGGNAGNNYANPHAATGIGLVALAYDRNGNLTSLINGTSSPATVYSWDYNNRLTTSTTNSITASYTYDPGGQRLSFNNGANTVYYPSKFYNIDSWGKVTKHIFAGDMMLATITGGNSGGGSSCLPPISGDWTINASCTVSGTAIAPASVIVSAGKVLTVSAGSKLLIDLKHYKLLVKKTGGILIKKTAAVRQVKTGDVASASSTTASTIYYQITDGLGGQAVSLNNAGNIAELADYYPFGSSRLDEQTGLNEQRKFIGQEYDAATGLNYLNARYYNSAAGQFISEDYSHLALGNADQLKQVTGQDMRSYLSDPQQLNSYSYGRDNPITKSDPKGNAAWLVGLVTYDVTAAWDVGSDIASNFKNPNLTWYEKFAEQDPNAAIRINKDAIASAASAMMMEAAGLALARGVAAKVFTKAETMVVKFVVDDAIKTTYQGFNGDLNDPVTGKFSSKIAAEHATENFPGSVTGTLAGEMISAARGRIPTTFRGSFAGSHAFTDYTKVGVSKFTDFLAKFLQPQTSSNKTKPLFKN